MNRHTKLPSLIQKTRAKRHLFLQSLSFTVSYAGSFLSNRTEMNAALLDYIPTFMKETCLILDNHHPFIFNC
ncbi:hypothetical protein GGQ77_001845 [Geobacillus thermodenitrificans]|nr:hypothetical protein [Geobacillus thermodenitrificans]MED0663304.1 hypothetical protein [Geobacillus thermodenitrificans]